MADIPLVRSSDNDGMLALFNMVNSFVDDVFPHSIGDIITENDVDTLGDFSSMQLKDWLPMLLILIICVIVGLLFIICFPLCGCCFCCCRCCCNNCKPEKVKHGKPKQPKKCKKWCCTSILFILVCVMFSMVITSFVATSMVKKEIGEDSYMVNDLVSGIDQFEGYIHQSVDDIEQAVFPPLNETIDDVFFLLEELPALTVATFAKETGVDPALYELEEYAQNLPILNGNLTQMDTSRSALVIQEDQLEQQLNDSKTALEPLLTGCGYPACSDLIKDLEDLRPDAQYDILDDVSLAVTATEQAVTNNIPEAVSLFVQNFENIATNIEVVVGDDVEEIKKQVEEMQETIETKFEEISQNIKSKSFEDLTDNIKKQEPTVVKYGTYTYQYLYLISGLCLIPVVFYFVSIPLGSFCGPKSAKHASNCLLAGIIWTFMFGIFFMLTTLVIFLIGGTSQGLVCRHVIGYDSDMQQLEQVIRNTVIEDSNRSPYNLTVKQLLDNCKHDLALYTAFNVAGNGFDISELLDLENTVLPDVIESLKNITFNIGSIEIISKEVNDTILNIETTTDDINFDLYHSELSKEVTIISLVDYANELYAVADALKDTNSQLADQIRAEADTLVIIHNTTVKAMEEEKETLSKATGNTYDITSSIQLSSVMYDLTIAQDIINTETDEMIQDIVGDTADNVYTLLDDLTKLLVKSVEDDIAKCRPAYEALTTVIYAPCVYFLYPFNAVWFSFGAYLFFATVTLFFATSVMGIFAIKALGLKINPVDESYFDRKDISLNQVAPMAPSHMAPSQMAPSQTAPSKMASSQMAPVEVTVLEKGYQAPAVPSKSSGGFDNSEVTVDW